MFDILWLGTLREDGVTFSIKVIYFLVLKLFGIFMYRIYLLKY